jgi:predicted RNA-binding Zn ribbon-like protein
MLWDDFLNSDWHDWRGTGKDEDRLDKPEWLEHLRTKYELPVTSPPVPGEMTDLKRLRSLLFDMVNRIAAGSLPDDDQMERLNRTMAQGQVTRCVSRDGDGFRVELAPARRDWPQAMAEIASSFAQTLADGELSRIRICDNPDCLWVYYDDTRNRSKRYCDDKCCGNLMKVRRFRAKKKAEQTPKPR